MIDSLIPPALKYITDVVLDNEEVKKFPNDFITASMKWISSWFLEDDPIVAATVESNKSDTLKKATLEDKLMELLKNQQFEQELRAQLETYQAQRSRIKNEAVDAKIEAEGNVHIGDKGTGDTTAYDEKNVLKGGSIKAGQDFHLGDD